MCKNGIEHRRNNMTERKRVPFEYSNQQDFKAKLGDWVGDVLYDILPEKGYEVRDEQIYTAFQIADAICDQKVHLAEAGLGTGKTFAYLLSAIPYARFTGKPVVIACATSALQEQLASPTGDIQTLSELLGLKIDARMAKDSRQYICDVRVMENIDQLGDMSLEVNQWLQTTTLGERSEIPMVPDHLWRKISWNPYVSCDVCDNRGFCKLIKAREHYRGAADLIIVDHETFFYDLWTRDERIDDGKLPILPNYSAVIFDEGHKILLPAAMQAGQQISKEEMDNITFELQEIQDARPSLMKHALIMEKASNVFFNYLYRSVVRAESSERLSIRMSDTLMKAAVQFRQALDGVLMELQIEQELYMDTLTPTQIQAFEGQMERAMLALLRFTRNTDEMIFWVNRRDKSFWVVPRNIGAMLDRYLYKKKIPVIFTSATLSNKGDFEYFARTIGIKNPSKSSVGSSFDMENQVVVRIAKDTDNKIETLVSLLNKNGGRALVLAKSLAEVKRIRQSLEGYEFPFEMLYEDKGDRGFLVQQFREDETSVLVGCDLWEGIDVPGDPLTLVVIWQMPFPVMDPLIEDQRKVAKEQGLDPVTTVDFPEMGLKLKQGCGRLIRREDDKGEIVILDSVMGTPWEKVVMGALPEGAEVKML